MKKNTREIPAAKEPAVSRATSIDVARLAGVSQATVSRAFSPDSKILPSTREKVLAAARALKYTPDAIARSLISNSSNMVGVIMQNFNSPFYPKILSEISTHLQKFGKQILFFYSNTEDTMQRLISQILQYRVDGIIITSAILSSELAENCAALGIPVVLFNRYTTNLNVQAVCCDNIQAGRDCADYLLQKGYRRFGYVASSENASTSLDRQKGFLDRLREHGILDCPVYQSDFSYEAGAQIVEEILASSKLPEALFCANDMIAAGVIDTARHKYSLRIPEDLAVVGFDNIPMASYSSYQITSFSQPTEDMIQAALQIILEPRKGNSVSNLRLFPCTLVERRTT